jgi:hypothetical protein
MTAEQSASGLKSECRIIGREFKSGGNQMLAADAFEEVPALEDIFDPRREDRITHPIKLHSPEAFVTDRTGAEILPVIFARRLGLLDQFVEDLIQRSPGKVLAVKIQHLAFPHAR